MDNIKHRLDYFQEEETTSSPLKELMTLVDKKNIMTIDIEDRYYLMAVVQRALDINIGGYVQFYTRNDMDELRENPENS